MWAFDQWHYPDPQPGQSGGPTLADSWRWRLEAARADAAAVPADSPARAIWDAEVALYVDLLARAEAQESANP